MLFKVSAPLGANRFPMRTCVTGPPHLATGPCFAEVIFDHVEGFEIVGPVMVDTGSPDIGADCLQAVWDQAVLPTRRSWLPAPWDTEADGHPWPAGAKDRKFHYLYGDYRYEGTPPEGCSHVETSSFQVWLATFRREVGEIVEHCVVFNTAAYLMNDDGSTIERYRVGVFSKGKLHELPDS